MVKGLEICSCITSQDKGYFNLALHIAMTEKKKSIAEMESKRLERFAIVHRKELENLKRLQEKINNTPNCP